MPRESSSLPGGVAKDEEDEELEFKTDKAPTDASHSQEGSETNILTSLFELSGVHSALKHDDIMDSAKQEHLIVEREGMYCFNKKKKKDSNAQSVLTPKLCSVYPNGNNSYKSGRARHGCIKGIQKTA